MFGPYADPAAGCTGDPPSPIRRPPPVAPRYGKNAAAQRAAADNAIAAVARQRTPRLRSAELATVTSDKRLHGVLRLAEHFVGEGDELVALLASQCKHTLDIDGHHGQLAGGDLNEVVVPLLLNRL